MRIARLISVLVVMGLFAPAYAALPLATLYKNAGCECCEEYAKYLRAHGFDVKVVATDALAEKQEQSGVVPEMAGCHSTHINGYVFEGHIPVASVKRLLAEKPKSVIGLSVPGMPAGSPGMGGEKRGPLTVYQLSRDAEPKVYAAH